MKGPLALLTARAIPNPVFVVGHGRSGTTALCNGLRRHRNIVGARAELPIAVHLASVAASVRSWDAEDWIHESMLYSERYLYDEVRRLVFEAGVGRHWGLSTMARDFVKGDNRAVFSKRYWSVKVYLGEEGHHSLQQLFPGARFVYIVRNGADVVESRRRSHMFSDRPFEEQCRQWATWVTLHRYRADVDNTISIHQEDLAANAPAVFGKIWGELDLPVDDRPGEYVASNLVHPFGESTEGGVDVQQALVARPPAYEKWTAEERRIFADLCGEAMRETGYGLDF